VSISLLLLRIQVSLIYRYNTKVSLHPRLSLQRSLNAPYVVARGGKLALILFFGFRYSALKVSFFFISTQAMTSPPKAERLEAQPRRPDTDHSEAWHSPFWKLPAGLWHYSRRCAWHKDHNRPALIPIFHCQIVRK